MAGMSTWHELERELDAWGAVGRPATLWWRDDDAEQPGPALERLLALLGDEVPLCLAVVPARADETLAARLATSSVGVAVHGYDHQNRAAQGKKSEFPEDRDPAASKVDIERGRARLEKMFGARLLPLFVPPWNRLADALVPALPELGFRGLSRFAPRRRGQTVADLVEINTHVDPIAWHQGGGFVGQGPALQALVGHLRARRSGHVDPGEPTGLLSHHARHDEELWEFFEDLKRALCSHPAAHWLSPADAFSLRP
jgi:hypothetical protein